MTRRAIIIGFLGAMFIAGVGYINDRILGLENFTNGHLLPIIVLGFTFLAVLALNPLLFSIKKEAAFSPRELALIVILMSAACSIPGRGLMEQFTQIMVTPFHWNRVNPGWQQHELMQYVPEGLLVDATDHDRVVTGYITGTEPTADGPAWGLPWLTTTLGRVPWAAWRAPLVTWLPMVFLVAVISICLSLIVHRQWSSHEFLSYPIADFTASLLERKPDRRWPEVLMSRLFWIGFAVIFLIRLNNAIQVWWPDYLIPVRLTFSFTPLAQLWPAINKVPWGRAMLFVRVFPLVIAFAFFLSAEISLTLGVSQLLWTLVAIPMVTVGIELNTQYGLGGWSGWQRAGSYTALGLMLLYTGRHYYAKVLKDGISPKQPEPEDVTNVWACRFLILSCILLVGLTMRIGLELPFALGNVMLMLLTFVIVSRISAETGLFFIQPRWQPYGVLLAMLGGCAMGPQTLVISGLFCTLLCIDQSQAVMPYMTNGLKLSEKLGLKLPKVANLTLLMYVLGVALAIVVVLAASYDVGTPTNYNWSYQRVPTMPFRGLEQEVLRLKAAGLMDVAQLPWYERFAYIHPKPNFLWAAGLGFGAVILFSFLRLRFPWWPLHPVLFLLWATYPMSFMAHSFLMGWFVKKMSVRFGGSKMVRKLRPLMIGIIAGEIAGALFCMIGGALFYAITGEKQMNYRFFPR